LDKIHEIKSILRRKGIEDDYLKIIYGYNKIINVRKKLILLMILFSVSFLLAFPRQGKKSPKDLPEKYRLWLEQEVVYIITPKEKEIYLRLESDRERDVFIEAFWKQRDPTPGSLENEFKEEHYQRILFFS